jgi:hypothetical protein
MKHHCDEAADNDHKTSKLSDSDEDKGEEASVCRSLRTSTTATMGAMTMTVEATVAKVVGAAIS